MQKKNPFQSSETPVEAKPSASESTGGLLLSGRLLRGRMSKVRLAGKIPLLGSLRSEQHQMRERAARAEGEDAALTGVTRSLHRRLLGLNLGSRGPAIATTEEPGRNAAA